jgi:hypothetical protein
MPINANTQVKKEGRNEGNNPKLALGICDLLTHLTIWKMTFKSNL